MSTVTTQATANSTDRLVPLFKCKTFGAVILKDGTLVPFVSRQFYTQDAALNKALQNCADTGEFGIYIDATEPAIDLDAATPMERLRKQIREELLAEQASGKVASADATSSARANPTAGMATTVSAAPVQANRQMDALEKLQALKNGANENADSTQP